MTGPPSWPALAVAAPLALAALLALPRARGLVGRAAPLAALPALALALGVVAAAPLELPWALLGVGLADASEPLTRGFLGFTAALWAGAAWFAHAYLGDHPRRAGFWAWFLVTMAGNLGVVLAADQATFYLAYAVMSLASYGLILHDRTEAARRAGKVYLVMALGGDVLILAAFLLTTTGGANLPLDAVPAAVAASPHAPTIALLLFLGFGVKAGAVLPLHVWLPLAHPVAPAPASALLSGAMIKAGLLGWLRFLPLGELALPELGAAWLVIGAAAVFYGAANGVTHRDPKTVLAYSSVSQMGLAMIAVGVAVAEPAAAAPAVAAIVVFATHHALAKGLLFLGAALAAPARAPAARWLVTAGLAWAALEIAGAPMTSGAHAKLELAAVVARHPRGEALAVVMSAGAVASALLMARFLWLAVPRAGAGGGARGAPAPGLWLPWVALLAVDTAALVRGAELAALARPAALWGAAWPLVTGVALAAAARDLGRRGARLPRLPAGDVLVGFTWALARGRAGLARADAALARARDAVRRPAGVARLRDALGRALAGLERADAALGRFGAVGLALAALFGVLVALLA